MSSAFEILFPIRFKRVTFSASETWIILSLFKSIFGNANAQQPPSGNMPSNQTMSPQDAADILGVDINASQDEIRLAHKKLMQKIHPDRGGSDALAKQINQAKNILTD